MPHRIDSGGWVIRHYGALRLTYSIDSGGWVIQHCGIDSGAGIWHYGAVRFSPNHLAFAIMAAFVFGSPASAATEAAGKLEQQRQLFKQAWQAGKTGQTSKMQALLPQLEAYPLYPYLLHHDLRLFHPGKLDQAVRFLANYPLFPHHRQMRKDWIGALAQRRLWRELLQLSGNDAGTGSAQTRCLVLTARLHLGQADDFQQQALPLFLHGKSQPKQCNPVFTELYRSIGSDVVWQRILLAFADKQPGLARHLGRHLDQDRHQMLQLWLNMYAAPQRGLATLPAADTAANRLLAMHGIKRLADLRGIGKASAELNRLEAKYTFTTAETDPSTSYIGIKAVRGRHPAMIDILGKVQQADAEVFSWQLVAALRQGRWQQLLHWTSTPVPEDDPSSLQRRYWHARALMETGQMNSARPILEKLADKRDYYGFLAADLVDRQYRMHAKAMPQDAGEVARVAAIPVIMRTREWYQLGETKLASREWRQARKHLDPDTLEYAAWHSNHWGWHYGSVLALGAAMSFDILELRFPLLYQEELQQAARQHGLNSGWLHGLIRSESLFVEDIRSPAGALGLMQVMPATGALVARKIGLKGYSKNKLLSAKYNVLIGSSYLKEMYDMFNGNVIYATAAYNAGPNRVVKWDRRMPCAAADVWVDTIPFTETKQYVKRVLSYSSIYDWMQQPQITTIRERIGNWQQNKGNCGNPDSYSQRLPN